MASSTISEKIRKQLAALPAMSKGVTKSRGLAGRLAWVAGGAALALGAIGWRLARPH